jgi:N-methylhydantoinase A
MLHSADPVGIAAGVAALRQEAVSALAREGYTEDCIGYEFELDMRYRGQDSELAITLDPDVPFDAEAVRAAFLQTYLSTYGYASKDDVEIVNLRLRARGDSGNSLDFNQLKSEQLTAAGKVLGTRAIYFNRNTGRIDTPLMERSAVLKPVGGPVILQSLDTTIVVPPGATATPDTVGNIVVTF